MTIPDGLQEWLNTHQEILWPAGFLSLAFLVLGLVLLPVIVVRLPSDYLVQGNRTFRKRFARMTIFGRIVLLVKNLFGGLLVLAGIIMLVTPGQGILSMVVGLGLMDFPRKQRLLRRTVGRKGLLRTINRFRARFARPPLQAPD